MSETPYAWTMQNAQRILWAMAVIIAVTSFAGDIFSIDIPDPNDGGALVGGKTARVFSALATAFYSAAFPLFGAAFLNRIDRMLEART